MRQLRDVISCPQSQRSKEVIDSQIGTFEVKQRAAAGARRRRAGRLAIIRETTCFVAQCLQYSSIYSLVIAKYQRLVTS